MKKNKKTLLEIIGGIVFFFSFLHAINRLMFFLATLKEHLFTRNGEYYKHPSGRMFYTKTGSGSPILLIHDLNPTSSGYEWNEVVDELSTNHTVYTVDLLGCGRSDKPNITYTSYLYVQQISSFVRDIIADSPECVVTGDSAALAVMTARIYPNLFNKITLINPTHFDEVKYFPSYIDKILKNILELPIIGTFIYNLYTSRSHILKVFHTEYFFSKEKSALKYISRYHEAAHLKGSSCKYLYASQRCHYLGCDVTTAFSNINIPIKVIFGDAMSYTEDMWDYIISLNPSANVCTIANAAYLPQLEHPSAFLKILKKD
ncbi:MAG: alpha/beta fold hydrolase [Lachnospiraceae bacterium]|nr:alpha/beta fold hydrolase [Lachnospiraceae bacterium]